MLNPKSLKGGETIVMIDGPHEAKVISADENGVSISFITADVDGTIRPKYFSDWRVLGAK